MQYTDITSRALTYLLRSPHLHIDMTEAIYRGLAEICCAQPDGVLLRLRAPWNGRPFLYECSAATPERSAALLEQLEPNVPLVAHQEYTATQYQALHPCVTQRCLQGQWPSFTPPARDPEVEIWPLDLGDLPVVLEHYDLIQDEEELSYLIRTGQLYGACVDDQLAGFAGTHVEGTLGLLTVLPEYRRRAKHHRRLKTVEHHCPALCSFFRLRLSLQENTHRPFKTMGGKNRLARAER